MHSLGFIGLHSIKKVNQWVVAEGATVLAVRRSLLSPTSMQVRIIFGTPALQTMMINRRSDTMTLPQP